MYVPDLPKTLNSRSIIYLDKSRFTLDVSGVAGFFGGAEAASAMGTVHICRNRKWWGWYNSPGSYEIARRYGLLTTFGFFFGGGHADPAELLTLFELDGRKGPQFLRVHSSSIIPETGHLAEIFIRKFTSPEYPRKEQPVGAAAAVELHDYPGVRSFEYPKVPSKERQPVGVTIAELHAHPGNNMPLKPIHTPTDSRILAAVPIIVSAGTCVMCAVVKDWYAFSLILLGIIANGISCLTIGSVKLEFMRPRLAGESDHEEQSHSLIKPHHVSGILITATNIVLLKGREDAAMAVAHGKFVFPSPDHRKSFYQYIGWCSILLLLQFIAQLLVIPQGPLFGQIMFVTSLGVSWCYNLWLCSLDKAEAQQKILMERVLRLKEGDVKRYQLDNWPAMVVFVLLTLALEDDEITEHELKSVLDVLVEDTSSVWITGKFAIMEQLKWLLALKHVSAVSRVGLDTVESLTVKGGFGWPSRGVSSKMDTLLDEAQSGIDMFKERFRRVRSLDGQHHDTPSFDQYV